MSVRKDPRTGNYFFRKWVQLPSGKRKRISGAKNKAGQPFKKYKECEDAEREAINALAHPEKAPIPTFAEWFHGRFWNEWVIGNARRANSPAEQESKRSIYRVHLSETFGPLPLDQIDEQLINDFRARIRAQVDKNGERLVSEKTLNNILAVLSKPLRYAERVRIISHAPHVGVAKIERPEIQFLEFEEVGALLHAAAADKEPEYEIAILLAVDAGLRIGEIKALAWSAVDMKARTITVERQVRPVKNEDGEYVETFGPPKGRKRRTIPMSPALHAALRNRLRTGFVVPGEGGEHKRTSETRSAMTRIAKRAGLQKKIEGDWHACRHSFGTHAAMLGANPWYLREWMGHQRIEETQLYADVARAHGRPIPPTILAAGASESDPNLRLFAQLSARKDVPRENRAANGQRNINKKK